MEEACVAVASTLRYLKDHCLSAILELVDLDLELLVEALALRLMEISQGFVVLFKLSINIILAIVRHYIFYSK